MNTPQIRAIDEFTPDEVRLLSCLIAAPSQIVAAEWVGCTPTHLRRLLKDLRSRLDVDNNWQLVLLAQAGGLIDLEKVLPFQAAFEHLGPEGFRTAGRPGK